MLDRAGLNVSLGLLLVLMGVCAYTDLRWRKIYNAVTYPGLLAALLLNAGGSVAEHWGVSSEQTTRVMGWIGWWPSVLGLLACGGIMLVCYVFFGQGGGDLKMMAMLGAFLGVREGIEVLLWTFVIAAALAMILLIWRVGAWQLVRQASLRLVHALRLKDVSQLSSTAGSPLKTVLDLAPSALVALVVVHFDLLGPLRIL